MVKMKRDKKASHRHNCCAENKNKCPQKVFLFLFILIISQPTVFLNYTRHIIFSVVMTALIIIVTNLNSQQNIAQFVE